MDSCYNLDQFGGTRVSDQAWQNAFYAAVGTALPAAVGCVAAGQEDFRADLTQITVPVLVKQGSEDQVLPPGATGSRLPALLGDVRHVLIRGAPHAIIWTHASEVSQRLLDFTASS